MNVQIAKYQLKDPPAVTWRLLSIETAVVVAIALSSTWLLA